MCLIQTGKSRRMPVLLFDRDYWRRIVDFEALAEQGVIDPRDLGLFEFGAVAQAYLESSLNDIRDRGKLRQFMRRLGREAPDPAGYRSIAEAVGLADPPPNAQAAQSPEPVPGTLEGVGDYLRGVFGLGAPDH